MAGVSEHDARQPPAAAPIAYVLGILWWIIAALIAMSSGLGAAAIWMMVPFVTIAMHEFGHWLAAVLSGSSAAVSAVRVGVGPSVGLISRRLRLGLLPGGGRVELVAPLDRGQRVAFSIGGPLANALFAIILAGITAGMSDTPAWIGLPVLASLVVAVASLVPVGLRNAERSDGFELISAIFNRKGRPSA
jgi:hypothetical protein